MAENQKIEKKTDKRDKKQKPNIGKRLLNFFANLKAELKRVIWPDRKKLIHSTVTVLAICIMAGIFLFLVDTGLGAILEGIGFYGKGTTSTTTAATAAVTTAVTTTVAATVPTTAATTAATTTSTSKAG